MKARRAVTLALALVVALGLAACGPLGKVPRPVPGYVDTWLLVHVVNPYAAAYNEPAYPDVPLTIHVEAHDVDGSPAINTTTGAPAPSVTYAVRSNRGDGAAWQPDPQGGGIRMRIQGDPRAYPLTVVLLASFAPNAFERKRQFRLACTLAGASFAHIDDDLTSHLTSTGQVIVRCAGIVRGPA